MQQVISIGTGTAGQAAGVGAKRRSLLDQRSPEVVIERTVDPLWLLGEHPSQNMLLLTVFTI